MKKTLLIAFSSFLCFNADAQTNTFPGPVGIGTTNPTLWFNPSPILAIEGSRPTLKMNTTNAEGLATLVFRSGSDNSTFSNDEFHINYRPYNAQQNPVPQISFGSYFSTTGDIFNIMGNGALSINSGLTNSSNRPEITSGSQIPGEIRAYSAAGFLADDGFLRLSAGAGTHAITKSFIDLTGYSTIPEMNQNIRFGTAGTERLRIDPLGNVGIGTTTPKEKLSVNGKIRAQEIKVESANWPDYVFEEEYKPVSLQETEAFIKANKHLPEMPSAKEAQENGISLGEMNAKLLKKIEELTLHVIEQQKRNEEQDKKIAKQQEEINQLKKN